MNSPWKLAPRAGTTIIGTCHFVCRAAANTYYARQGLDVVDVQGKLDAQEIFLGPPPLTRLEDLILLDGGTRYGIVDKS